MSELDTIDAVCLAELGKGNDLCRTKYNVNLSDGQFSYRLTKAKNAAGYKKGDGFRKAWREGRSEHEDLVGAVLPSLKETYRERILSKIEKPTVQVSPKGRR